MGASFSKTTVIGGTYDKEYESVKSMFRKNFENGLERDAQLCVYVEGRKVVDLWGSAEGDLTYTGDSLQCVFSSSKAITAIAIASIADKGLLSYSNTIASYFPEFGANSKDTVKLEDILRHESGVANLHTSLNPRDLYVEEIHKGTVGKLIASDHQVFPEHTPREYHNLTGGWIMNEVVRRVTPDKITLGGYIRRELHEKHGLDIHLGLTDKELERTRQLHAMPSTQALLHSIIPNAFGSQVEHNVLVFSKMLDSFKRKFIEVEKRGIPPVFTGIDQGLDPGHMMPLMFNSEEWRRGEHPTGNVHASARALGKLASAMAEGGKTVEGQEILTTSAWELLHGNPVVRQDASMNGCRTEFTQGGVNLFKDYEDDKFGERILKSGRDGFIGWLGIGGSVMQWHPALRIGFGYACTYLTWWDLANVKARKLQKEVKACAKNRQQTKIDENSNTSTLVDK